MTSTPKMSKSHYEFLAGILLETRPNPTPDPDDVTTLAYFDQWAAMVDTLAVRLKVTNPQFNVDRFRTAAGL